MTVEVLVLATEIPVVLLEMMLLSNVGLALAPTRIPVPEVPNRKPGRLDRAPTASMSAPTESPLVGPSPGSSVNRTNCSWLSELNPN